MLPEPGVHIGTRILVGGAWICLDFCNTIDGRDSAYPHEWFIDYLDLVRWALHTEALPSEQADPLLRRAAQDSACANAVVKQAQVIREAMYRIFTATIGGQPVPSDSLDTLNAALGDALNQQRLVPGPERFRMEWRDEDSLERVLWPVVRSAADLLTSDELNRVRLCPGCRWLFFDQSRNRSRLWCDMRYCGNRAKRKSYYQRHKQAASD